METERRLITLPDGRDIDLLLAGPPDGLPFVMHEGTPIGLVLYPPTVTAAQDRNLRPILMARPGYERSTPRPRRRVADVAGDVAAVLDTLGLDTFVTAGWSGGGPHALACAALLPGRCLAAASIAGVAPYHAPGLDFTAGMGPENVAEFGAALRGPQPLTEFLDREAAGFGAVTGPGVAAALGGLIADADRAVLTGGFADHIAAGVRASVSTGIAGWRDDDLAFVADWGFSLSGEGKLPGGEGKLPVAVWQGDQDRMVPYAHGQWLAANIPGARAHLLPGEGHLTIGVSGLGVILDDLLDLAGLS
ncbi:MAG TPA: alpha/beta hydrolase [Streptosporangiaceae bacterium]|nr:alpha/beta hydrolase [Streptosporangiaceae bacterium]